MIEIWAPKWKTKEVLIAKYKVKDGMNKIIFTRVPSLKGKEFFVSSELIRRCVLKPKANGSIDCYMVPLEWVLEGEEKMRREGLKEVCKWVRQETYEMCVGAGAGHIAPAFSCTEIFVALYHGGVMVHYPKEPKNSLRDRLVLSKGQGCASLYAVLAHRGYFPAEDLRSYTQQGTYLGGHSESNVPGVEAFTGSLGNGIGIAVGLAWAAKLKKEDWHTFCLMGDGELNEGSCWEAFMFAPHHKLDNLTVIVDKNEQQAVDFTADVLDLGSLELKMKAFGFEVITLQDGHNLDVLIETFNKAKKAKNGKPKCVICETVKGKGISYMERNPIWHYRAPTEGEEIAKGREELK